ncbi:MAG TPA: DUF2089 domain-containing protein [Chloroflexia bacterium]|nr:DUF2089 domain-containing protein [Chloroflexia bacterium]
MAPDNVRYPVPGTCPVCGEELTVTRLRCGRCATTLEGLFSLGRFYYLSREQQQFIAIFVKCRGKIKDVEEELGISYPTVVSRLDEVIAALGFDLAAAPGPAAAGGGALAAISGEQRQLILDELGAGRLTSAEALALLQGQDLPARPKADGAGPAEPAG